jgi:nucleoid DNA-binding protein
MSLSCGEEVSLRNFGRFKVRSYAKVMRQHPITGEPMPVEARFSVGFVPADSFKERVNRSMAALSESP